MGIILWGGAFGLSLFSHYVFAAIAGAYTILGLAGCYLAERRKNIFIPMLWVAFLCAHTFFIRPYSGSGAQFWDFIILSLFSISVLKLNYNYLFALLGSVAFVTLYIWAVNVFFDSGMPYSGRAAFPLLNPNNMGCIMAAACLLATQWKRYLWAAVFFAALLATESHGAFLAACAGFSFLLIERNIKYLPFVFAAAFLGILFILFSDIDGVQQRIPVWESTIEIIKQNFFWGTGVGSFPAYYKFARIENYTAGMFADNDYLQIFSELGLFGLTLFLAFLLYVVYNSPNRSAVVVICVCALSSPTFYIGSIALLFGLIASQHMVINK